VLIFNRARLLRRVLFLFKGNTYTQGSFSRMKKLFLTTAVSTFVTGSAFAADITGDIAVDFTQNADDKIVGTQTIGFGVDAPIGDAGFGVEMDGSNVTLDSWYLGTTLSGIGLSLGDQGDILDSFEGKMEAVGGTTLANPDDSGESLSLSVAGADIMVGLTDMSDDITDVENVQGTYSISFSGIEAGAGVDYNMDSEEFTYLGLVGYGMNVANQEVGLGTTFTYANETFAYETSVNAFGITGFLNGDQDDTLQNVGAGYTTTLAGLDVYAEGAYNLDSEEFKPAAGIAFAF